MPMMVLPLKEFDASLVATVAPSNQTTETAMNANRFIVIVAPPHVDGSGENERPPARRKCFATIGQETNRKHCNQLVGSHEKEEGRIRGFENILSLPFRHPVSSERFQMALIRTACGLRTTPAA